MTRQIKTSFISFVLGCLLLPQGIFADPQQAVPLPSFSPLSVVTNSSKTTIAAVVSAAAAPVGFSAATNLGCDYRPSVAVSPDLLQTPAPINLNQSASCFVFSSAPKILPLASHAAISVVRYSENQVVAVPTSLLVRVHWSPALPSPATGAVLPIIFLTFFAITLLFRRPRVERTGATGKLYFFTMNLRQLAMMRC